MIAKTLTLIACLSCFLPTVAQAAGPIKVIKVDVQCTGDDMPGQRLCFALKERIRGSTGFELVDTQEAKADPLGFGVYLVSLDVGSDNAISAVAVAFTIPQQQRSDVYLNVEVVVVGGHRVDEVASGLLSDIDKQSDLLRKVSN